MGFGICVCGVMLVFKRDENRREGKSQGIL
jgi:hypothetical protein